MTETAIVDVEPRTAAIVRRTIPLSDIPAAQRAARATLDAAMAAAGAAPAGPRLTVWRPPVDGMMDYAPGVFVADGFVPSGAATLFALPQGRAAHLRYEGPYEGLPGAWGRLFEACRHAGWPTAGVSWEVYEEAGPHPVTDLNALLA